MPLPRSKFWSSDDFPRIHFNSLHEKFTRSLQNPRYSIHFSISGAWDVSCLPDLLLGGARVLYAPPQKYILRLSVRFSSKPLMHCMKKPCVRFSLLTSISGARDTSSVLDLLCEERWLYLPRPKSKFWSCVCYFLKSTLMHCMRKLRVLFNLLGIQYTLVSVEH